MHETSEPLHGHIFWTIKFFLLILMEIGMSRCWLMKISLQISISIYRNSATRSRPKNLLTSLQSRRSRKKHGITKKISVRTAQHYLNVLGFRFTCAKKGQYSNGHEREDVVLKRTTVFIPKWKALEPQMRNWKKDDVSQMEEVTTEGK